MPNICYYLNGFGLAAAAAMKDGGFVGGYRMSRVQYDLSLLALYQSIRFICERNEFVF